MITSWGMDAVSFAETSYTVAAARSIRSKFRQLGWKAVLGPPARDKFATRSGAASFRGLSKGVGLASSCYEVVPGFVPQEVWAGGRIHLGCVNQGSIPIHIVTVYLLPNSPLGFPEIRNKQCCIELGCPNRTRPCWPSCHPRRLQCAIGTMVLHEGASISRLGTNVYTVKVPV